VLWLPRYYRYSKVAMRIESTRRDAIEAFRYSTKPVKELVSKEFKRKRTK